MTDAGRRAAAERLRLRATRSYGDIVALQLERQRVREQLLAQREGAGAALRHPTDGSSGDAPPGASAGMDSAGALTGRERLREAKKRLRALVEVRSHL